MQFWSRETFHFSNICRVGNLVRAAHSLVPALELDSRTVRNSVPRAMQIRLSFILVQLARCGSRAEVIRCDWQPTSKIGAVSEEKTDRDLVRTRSDLGNRRGTFRC